MKALAGMTLKETKALWAAAKKLDKAPKPKYVTCPVCKGEGQITPKHSNFLHDCPHCEGAGCLLAEDL